MLSTLVAFAVLAAALCASFVFAPTVAIGWQLVFPIILLVPVVAQCLRWYYAHLGEVPDECKRPSSVPWTSVCGVALVFVLGTCVHVFDILPAPTVCSVDPVICHQYPAAPLLTRRSCINRAALRFASAVGYSVDVYSRSADCFDCIPNRIARIPPHAQPTTTPTPTPIKPAGVEDSARSPLPTRTPLPAVSKTASPPPLSPAPHATSTSIVVRTVPAIDIIRVPVQSDSPDADPTAAPIAPSRSPTPPFPDSGAQPTNAPSHNASAASLAAGDTAPGVTLPPLSILLRSAPLEDQGVYTVYVQSASGALLKEGLAEGSRGGGGRAGKALKFGVGMSTTEAAVHAYGGVFGSEKARLLGALARRRAVTGQSDKVSSRNLYDTEDVTVGAGEHVDGVVPTRFLFSGVDEAAGGAVEGAISGFLETDVEGEVSWIPPVAAACAIVLLLLVRLGVRVVLRHSTAAGSHRRSSRDDAADGGAGANDDELDGLLAVNSGHARDNGVRVLRASEDGEVRPVEGGAEDSAPRRLAGVDALRGLAGFMMSVTDYGGGPYPWVKSTSYSGSFSLADIVPALFVFVLGVSTALAHEAKRIPKEGPVRAYVYVIQRVAIWAVLGVAVQNAVGASLLAALYGTIAQTFGDRFDVWRFPSPLLRDGVVFLLLTLLVSFPLPFRFSLSGAKADAASVVGGAWAGGETDGAQDHAHVRKMRFRALLRCFRRSAVEAPLVLAALAAWGVWCMRVQLPISAFERSPPVLPNGLVTAWVNVFGRLRDAHVLKESSGNVSSTSSFGVISSAPVAQPPGGAGVGSLLQVPPALVPTSDDGAAVSPVPSAPPPLPPPAFTLSRTEHCPANYLGVGGVTDGGRYFNCTGGTARVADDIIFGEHKWLGCMYCRQFAFIDNVAGTCAFPPRHDPDGMVGWLVAFCIGWVGLVVGRLLRTEHHLREWVRAAGVPRTTAVGSVVADAGACVMMFVMGLVLMVCGVIMAGASLTRTASWQIPYIPSLMTPAHGAAVAGAVLVVFSIMHYVIVIRQWWGGQPFIAIGRNSLAFYVIHGLLALATPFLWGASRDKVAAVANAFMAVTANTVIVYLMGRRGVFITV